MDEMKSERLLSFFVLEIHAIIDKLSSYTFRQLRILIIQRTEM